MSIDFRARYEFQSSTLFLFSLFWKKKLYVYHVLILHMYNSKIWKKLALLWGKAQLCLPSVIDR